MIEEIDIGNVRGIKGEKGDKGERGLTPSYDDIRYKKENDEFVKLATNKNHDLHHYVDALGRMCDEHGYLLDENNQVTDVLGEPFDVGTYGYYWKPIHIDTDGKYTDANGIFLDENWDEIYAETDFISDISSYIYSDEDGYAKLVNSINKQVVLTLTNPENFTTYRDFFNEIEGDIKYYICDDDPRTNITFSENQLTNTCGYLDENGVLVTDSNEQKISVPLEKNALYLYNESGLNDNNVMHYDIYLCKKANTVPIKLVSRSDFVFDYNVIDELTFSYGDDGSNIDEEREVWLNIITRGTRGQFYSMGEVDDMFDTYVNNKLGANNGIAQLNSSGIVPSSQLPSFVDEVVEGTMNSGETAFTVTGDSSATTGESGKIYVDVSTKKTYRWTGSEYVFISNPIVVDDGGTTAYSSTSGQGLESVIGTASLNTTAQTLIGGVNELVSGKEDTANKTTSWNSTTNNIRFPSEKLVKDSLDLKVNKSDIVTDLVTDDDTKVLSAKQGKLLEDNKLDKTSVVDSVSDGNSNPVTSNAVFDNLDEIFDELSCEDVVLYSDNPIVESGDVCKLKARLFGFGSYSQDYKFYKKGSGSDVLLDTVSTSNGLAEYSYTGSGVGKNEFYVKCGSVVSQPYEVYDYIFYDVGVTGNKNSNWVTGGSLKVETDETGTKLTTQNQQEGRYMTNTSFNGDFELLIHCKCPDTIRIRFVSSARDKTYQVQMNHLGWRTYKFKRENGVFSVKAQTDGETTWWDYTSVEADTLTTENCNFEIFIPVPAGTDRTMTYNNITSYYI